MEKFFYRHIKWSDLEQKYSKDLSVCLVLNNRQAKALVRLIETLNNIRRYDKKNRIRLLWSCLKGFYFFPKTYLLYPKLLEVFGFYNVKMPYYRMNSMGNGYCEVEFLSEAVVQAQKSK